MNRPLNLTQALAEWRRLAEAEGQAIRSGNWSLVMDCQTAVAALRDIIDQLAQRNRAAGIDPLKTKPTHRSVVLELIELQRRNLESIKDRRERLSSHVEQLTRSSRNLRGIQRSYVPPGRTGWSSYS